VTSAPAADVRAEFGVRNEVPHLLSGGQGATWRAGDVVFKRVSSVGEAEWVASVLAALPEEEGFRISRPIRSRSGTWAVGGWCAWQPVEGVHHFSGRWSDVLSTGRRFHLALRDVPRPAFLDDRDDVWSAGDRAAWEDDVPTVIHDELRPLVRAFASYRTPSELPSQVIHGDLTGNVLFAPGAAPAVIDFVPYFRPVQFALAVVVADAIAWHHASYELVRLLPAAGDPHSMLARAAIYRLVAADHAAEQRMSNGSYLSDNVTAHRRILRAIRGGVA
jgi:uncharacterized protein (TIGR02569 family)